jgi:hypothetical protein
MKVLGVALGLAALVVTVIGIYLEKPANTISARRKRSVFVAMAAFTALASAFSLVVGFVDSLAASREALNAKLTADQTATNVKALLPKVETINDRVEIVVKRATSQLGVVLAPEHSKEVLSSMAKRDLRSLARVPFRPRANPNTCLVLPLERHPFSAGAILAYLWWSPEVAEAAKRIQYRGDAFPDVQFLAANGVPRAGIEFVIFVDDNGVVGFARGDELASEMLDLQLRHDTTQLAGTEEAARALRSFHPSVSESEPEAVLRAMLARHLPEAIVKEPTGAGFRYVNLANAVVANHDP